MPELRTDTTRPATRQASESTWMQRGLVGAVRGYRLLLSPWLGSSCRFWPTCSAYAIGALEQHGAGCGSLLAAGRILRCHPWCQGGHDPVPPAGTGLFTALLRREPAGADGGEPAPTSSSGMPPDRVPTDPVSRKLSA